MHIYLIISLLLGVITSAILMPWLQGLCHKRSLYDFGTSRQNSQHSLIPRIGGIVFVPAIIVGVSATLLLRLQQQQIGPTIFISTVILGCGGLAVSIIGIIDDLTGISSRLKWAVKLVSAAVFPLAGLCLNNLYGLFGISELSHASSIILTFLTTICIVEAINSLDDSDGLSGTLSALVLGSLGIHFYALGCYTYSYLAMALLGGLLVYLYYNIWGDSRIGTKIYMGNCGTLILGFTISYLALKYAMDNNRVMQCHTDGLVTAFSLLILPIAEYLRVTVSWIWHSHSGKSRQSLFLHHKLALRHLSERTTTLIMALLSLTFYGVNVFLLNTIGAGTTVIFTTDVLLYGICYLIVWLLVRKASNEENDSQQALPDASAEECGIPGLVSVIMPTWNSSRYVSASIQAILSQTYQNLELIITDDASTDGTPDILRKWAEKDSRVRIILNTKNGGAGVSRNCSIKEARGQYIAFCDSDDRWTPEKLDTQIRFMQHKKVALCFSPYYTCDAHDHYLGYVSAPRRVTLFQMMCDNKIGFLTAIYDTHMLGKHFMPAQRKRQDHALLLTLLKKCRHAYSVPEPLAHYRLHPGNMSGNKMGLLKYNARTYNAVFGWPMPLCWLFLFTFFLPSYFGKRIKNILINIFRIKLQ